VIHLDEAVSATCTISKGDLPIEIWWSFQDNSMNIIKTLSTNDGVMILRNSQKISSLNIDSVQGRHRGNYTCFAKNKAGIAHHSAFLHVNGYYNQNFY
jgi:hypothetical protein